MKRKILAVAVAAGGLALIPVASAVAQPIITGGLVNVTVANVAVLNDVSLGVALNAAADICGVSVNVLASQIGQGPVDCTSTTGGIVQIIPAG